MDVAVIALGVVETVEIVHAVDVAVVAAGAEAAVTIMERTAMVMATATLLTCQNLLSHHSLRRECTLKNMPRISDLSCLMCSLLKSLLPRCSLSYSAYSSIYISTSLLMTFLYYRFFGIACLNTVHI